MNVAAELLPVAGVVPLTTVDFPGRLACVVFTQGCPWRCFYCHNAAMRPLSSLAEFSWGDVIALLEPRRGFLEAVVFSGGEPTLHEGLAAALRQVREMGFLTGLHTAGMYPERIGRLLDSLDWVGLDVKAPLDERYVRLTGDRHSARQVRTSLEILKTAKVEFQLRTTVAADEGSERDYQDLCRQLEWLGLPSPVRQEMRAPRIGRRTAGVPMANGDPSGAILLAN